jgi:hypothetical protein
MVVRVHGSKEQGPLPLNHFPERHMRKHKVHFQAPLHHGCDEAVINYVTSHTEHGGGYMRKLPTWTAHCEVFWAKSVYYGHDPQSSRR